ncbi:Virus attachment protein p12 family protein [Ligilactobacillus sp. WC1T17]|uniref:Virus attachment protein p12 family protein n=1 Tax=Ligilactobacillus ruminis TaxID=1623 RepID=A0ABY1A9Z0_9LACO|nr:Virus attachment protein p12 family protein [Ligilactobacillus ruminis]
MIATVILAILIFGAFFYVGYTRFIKRSKGGCHSCHDQGCPLADRQQMNTNHH